MPSKKHNKITNEDILTAINAFSTEVDKRFQSVDKRFEGIDKRFEGIDKRFNRIEATMVTKDYLDEKLGNLRGDFMVLLRKGNAKLESLVKTLHKNKVVSAAQKKQLFRMEPFAQKQ